MCVCVSGKGYLNERSEKETETERERERAAGVHLSAKEMADERIKIYVQSTYHRAIPFRSVPHRVFYSYKYLA